MESVVFKTYKQEMILTKLIEVGYPDVSWGSGLHFLG